MLFNIIKITLLTSFLSILALPAFAQYDTKDSFYFMKDDGIFSEEEKDMEAEYIKRQCEISAIEKDYYNCSCIAGAFRLKRDEEQIRPQTLILHDLYNDKESKCVHSEKIAGNAYSYCKRFSDFFHPRKTDNKEYCECVANKVAKDFSKEPRLRTRYINHLKIEAMSFCDKNRIAQ